jgi:hypothetical protein
MAEVGAGSNVRLEGPVNVWFDGNQPTEIHLTLNDPDLVHPESGKDGLHLGVARGQISELFEPGEAAFDDVAAAVTVGVEIGSATPAEPSAVRRAIWWTSRGR